MAAVVTHPIPGTPAWTMLETAETMPSLVSPILMNKRISALGNHSRPQASYNPAMLETAETMPDLSCSGLRPTSAGEAETPQRRTFRQAGNYNRKIQNVVQYALHGIVTSDKAVS